MIDNQKEKHKIKLGELKNIVDSFNILLDKELPIKTSYRLSKLIKPIFVEYQTFEESRIKIITKYGEKDKNNELIMSENGSVNIDKNKIIEFNKELAELCDLEIEISFDKFKLSDFSDINIAPKILVVLQIFFEDLE